MGLGLGGVHRSPAISEENSEWKLEKIRVIVSVRVWKGASLKKRNGIRALRALGVVGGETWSTCGFFHVVANVDGFG